MKGWTGGTAESESEEINQRGRSHSCLDNFVVLCE